MQVAEHGGLSNIRDEGLLNSALVRPQNLYEYKQADLYKLTAAYVFLSINGIIFTAPEAETTAMVIALAADEIDQGQFAKWLKQHSIAELDQ